MKAGAEPVTDRQRAVLCFLERYRREGNEVPTLRALARCFRIHHSTMQEHLSELHRKRYLRAPLPGWPIGEPPALPSLPIPERDEDDAFQVAAAASIETATMVSPATREPVTIEKRTLPGQSKPSELIVRTRTRVRRMRVLRDGGPNGPITGFDVIEEVEG